MTGVLVTLGCLLVAAPSAAEAAEIIVYHARDLAGSHMADMTIWKMNADGSNNQPLDLPYMLPGGLAPFSCDKQEPALSPSGTRVAFVASCASMAGGQSSLWIVDIDGGNLQRLASTDYPTPSSRRPEFSPDGQTIVFDRTTSIWAINANGGNLRQLVNWGGTQRSPAFFPDGQRIAFVSDRTPSGTSTSGMTLWSVSLLNGGNPQQIPFASGDDPSVSPDAATIALGGPRIMLVNADGSGWRYVVDRRDFDEEAPDFAANGNRLVYTERQNFVSGTHNLALINTDGSGYTPFPAFWTNYPSQASLGEGPAIPPPGTDDRAVLLRYAPTLNYSTQETYRADSAAMMTDNCLLDSRGRVVRSNYLNDDRSRHLAASCPSLRYDDLSLNYLGSYAVPFETDRIDADNNYAEDAQRLHGSGQYADRVYGRVKAYADGDRVLQYWLFYYNNPKTYVGFGAHEGDWEMVQVHLDAASQPYRAAYAQHKDGESCLWSQVERQGDRPMVYVAEGSHASYFSPGFHNHGNANDWTFGGGDEVTPAVEDIRTLPAWFSWPGHWGGSVAQLPVESDSPRGPKFQGSKWDDPRGWSENPSVDECREPGVVAAAARARTQKRLSNSRFAPAAPYIRVRRAGRRVIVDYRYRARAQSKKVRPWLLLTSVDSRGTRYPPLTVRTRVRGPRGTVRMPRGLGRAPFTVRASVLAKNGARSPAVAVPLR